MQPIVLALLYVLAASSVGGPSPNLPRQAGLADVSVRKATRVVIPEFPEGALRPVTYVGDVVVSVDIGDDGTVTAATIVSGHPRLRDVAVEAARQWQFEQRTANVPKQSCELIFSFQLVDDRNSTKHAFSEYAPPNHVVVRAKQPLVVNRETAT